MSQAFSRSVLAGTLLGLVALAAQAAEPAAIAVSNPYVRGMPPGQPNTAVFMTLTNASAQARELVSATSPAAQTVELHTHVKEGGTLQMRQVERIAIPAGQSVALVPGGLHIMLIGLRDYLAPGTGADLTLTFDDGSTVEVQAPVRSPVPLPMRR